MWELTYKASGKSFTLKMESVDTLHVMMVSILDMFPDTSFSVKFQGK